MITTVGSTTLFSWSSSIYGHLLGVVTKACTILYRKIDGGPLDRYEVKYDGASKVTQ